MESEIFQGNALSAVDGKSRLSIPAFVRNFLVPAEPRHVHLTAHASVPCVIVHGDSYSDFLIAELDRLREKGEEKGTDPFEFDDRERGLWGMSETLNCDSGGRVVLSGLLREHGRIEDMGLFVGCGRYVELWNPKVAMEVGGDMLKRIASFHLRQREAKS